MNKVILASISVSLLWHPIAYLIDSMLPDDETSSNLLVNDYMKHAVRWDSIFFIELVDHGYRFQKNHAFQPGIVLFCNFLKLFTQQYLILYFMVQKIINLFSAILAFKITQQATKDIRYSTTVGLLFIFSPASVFFNSFYNESLFTFLSFLGIYLFQQKQYTYSTVVLAISILFRSNGIFYIVFNGYPILASFIQGLYYKRKLFLDKLLAGIFTALIYMLVYSIILYYPYTLYCFGDDQPSWCQNFIPNIYTYIQENFWGVGFLASYSSDKIFYLFQGFWALFFSYDWIYRNLTNRTYIKIDSFLIQMLIPLIILLFIVTFFAYINCSNRFLSSQILFYWILAEQLSYRRYLTLFYLIYSNLSGLVLFGNFLLWL